MKYLNFLGKLAIRESANVLHSINDWGFLGLYQMGEAALIDAGFIKRDNNVNDRNYKSYEWTDSSGVSSYQEFLKSPQAQQKAATSYHKELWRRLENRGVTDKVGEYQDGILITKSGLLAASHLVGDNAVAKWLKGSGETPKDALGTKATEYLKLFAGYQLDGIEDRVPVLSKLSKISISALKAGVRPEQVSVPVKSTESSDSSPSKQETAATDTDNTRQTISELKQSGGGSVSDVSTQPATVTAEATKPAVITPEGVKTAVVHTEPPPKLPVLTPDSTKIPVLSPDGVKIPVISAEPSKLPVLTPDSIKIPVLSPEGVKIPVISAEPSKLPVLTPDSIKIPVLSPEGVKIPIISAEPSKLPVLTPDSIKIPVLSPDGIKIPVISAEPSKLPSNVFELLPSIDKTSTRESSVPKTFSLPLNNDPLAGIDLSSALQNISSMTRSASVKTSLPKFNDIVFNQPQIDVMVNQMVKQLQPVVEKTVAQMIDQQLNSQDFTAGRQLQELTKLQTLLDSNSLPGL